MFRLKGMFFVNNFFGVMNCKVSCSLVLGLDRFTNLRHLSTRSLDSLTVRMGKDHRVLLTLDLCLPRVYQFYCVFHLLNLGCISMPFLLDLLNKCPARPLDNDSDFNAMSIFRGHMTVKDYISKINTAGHLFLFILYFLLWSVERAGLSSRRFRSMLVEVEKVGMVGGEKRGLFDDALLLKKFNCRRLGRDFSFHNREVRNLRLSFKDLVYVNKKKFQNRYRMRAINHSKFFVSALEDLKNRYDGHNYTRRTCNKLVHPMRSSGKVVKGASFRSVGLDSLNNYFE